MPTDISIEDFDRYFRAILEKATDRESRIIKLEFLIPQEYERDMKGFSSTFFSNNPFELTVGDLDEVSIEGRLIKRIRPDRKPSTFLSLFRLTEMYRQFLEDIHGDIKILAGHYKQYRVDQPEKELIKELILKETLSAGRVYQKLSLVSQNFHTKLVHLVNDSLAEAKSAVGPEGFINLRKFNGESFLGSVLNPEYKSMISNSLFLIAISKKIRQQRKIIQEKVLKQTE
ncbi:MAG: hypothetical protein H7A24_03905 [Leptospiraceae bacterium]|nr:hypothetical protein [Leptospiraceae bacterium]MCP5510997.1 hypothetical protein [Leptospiraceae bacterium]